MVVGMRRRRKGKSKNSLFFTMLIIIPLLGSLMGYAISKAIIIPYLSQGDKAARQGYVMEGQKRGAADNGEEETKPVLAYQKIFDIQGFSLYRLQVGAFSKWENARKLVEELEDEGMAADLKEEGLYKVFVLYAFDKDILEKQLPETRKRFKDAHISQASYPSVGIGFPESMTREVEVLWKQLRQCREMIEVLVNSIAAGEDVRSAVIQQRTQVEHFMQQLEELELATPLDRYEQVISTLYAGLLENYSEFVNQKEGSRQLAIGLINTYINFIESISRIL